MPVQPDESITMLKCQSKCNSLSFFPTCAKPISVNTETQQRLQWHCHLLLLLKGLASKT